MSFLGEFGAAVSSIADSVGTSIVGIGNRWRGGSGVVIGANRVLTSAHNLHGEEPRVLFPDGREVQASVLGVDREADLAVLEVDTGDAPAVAWGDPASLARWPRRTSGQRGRPPRLWCCDGAADRGTGTAAQAWAGAGGRAPGKTRGVAPAGGTSGAWGEESRSREGVIRHGHGNDS